MAARTRREVSHDLDPGSAGDVAHAWTNSPAGSTEEPVVSWRDDGGRLVDGGAPRLAEPDVSDGHIPPTTAHLTSARDEHDLFSGCLQSTKPPVQAQAHAPRGEHLVSAGHIRPTTRSVALSPRGQRDGAGGHVQPTSPSGAARATAPRDGLDVAGHLLVAATSPSPHLASVARQGDVSAGDIQATPPLRVEHDGAAGHVQPTSPSGAALATAPRDGLGVAGHLLIAATSPSPHLASVARQGDVSAGNTQATLPSLAAQVRSLLAANVPPRERAPRLERTEAPLAAPRVIVPATAVAPRVRRLVTPGGLRLPPAVMAWLRATAAPTPSALELQLVEALDFIQAHGAALTAGASIDDRAVHED
jgi:hypothetical protein